ncbi:MAG: thiamine/thiamine pyrophosphate ABC transporter, permease protein [Gammaproteobacteria bacterium]|nr:MAG: thiamine/thiamine pyrophosphate ABC transporter, permease protein [Gammaproteobacteria bacterium]
MSAMNTRAFPAVVVLALLAIVIIAPLVSLVNLGALPGFDAGDLQFWRSAYIRRVLSFSLWQASLSTLCSVLPAIIVARAFALQPSFPLRAFILRLFALPLVVPSVVAVMGVVSVYGSDGWIPLGRSLYGLGGILLAHVFFNLPLAVRLLLPHWQAIPQRHWQLATQLDMNGWQRFRFIEWPALREGLPGVMLLVFMLCLTSFAVVLTLGGGPKSTTLEVAIYQSLRFDFEPVRAVVLALLQLTLCMLVAGLTLKLQRLPEVEITVDAASSAAAAKRSVLQLGLILLAAVYVAMPLTSILYDVLTGPLTSVLGKSVLWRALGNSLLIGLSAALVSVSAGWLLLRYSAGLVFDGEPGKARLIELAGSIVYVVPPLVIGTGMFVMLSPHVDVFDWVFPIVIGVNALMGLPFVIRTLGPAMRQNHSRYHLLCQSLALDGWNRFRYLEWPLLRRPLGLALALATALALGDLGVIALFGTPEKATLTLLIYQQLGAYLIADATVTALLLLLLCLAVFWLLERLVGGRQHA